MTGTVLVTGASGLVGRAVVDRLLRDGIEVRATARSSQAGLPISVELMAGLDLGNATDWSAALAGVGTVIHCAARVHVMHEAAAEPLIEFRRVNVGGTVALAAQAAGAGVRRFVFVSSIKVNGEHTSRGRPFHVDDVAAPVDPYGISKLEAEVGLRQVAEDTGLEVAVVRPPLVYGPGVKANFLRMMNWVQRGIPLPFGSIDNRRSLVALDNLVDLLLACSRHPAAAGQTFLAGDGEDLSTTELLRRIGQALGQPARLIPVPMSWLEASFSLMGKRELGRRLCESLQVDITKTRKLLNWSPIISPNEALIKTATAFLLAQRR